jgi:hypothetical protein
MLHRECVLVVKLLVKGVEAGVIDALLAALDLVRRFSLRGHKKVSLE